MVVPVCGIRVGKLCSTAALCIVFPWRHYANIMDTWRKPISPLFCYATDKGLWIQMSNGETF